MTHPQDYLCLSMQKNKKRKKSKKSNKTFWDKVPERSSLNYITTAFYPFCSHFLSPLQQFLHTQKSLNHTLNHSTLDTTTLLSTLLRYITFTLTLYFYYHSAIYHYFNTLPLLQLSTSTITCHYLPLPLSITTILKPTISSHHHYSTSQTSTKMTSTRM